MTAGTFFIRCGNCEEMYTAEINLMCGEPIWLKPKVKRATGSCRHDVDSAEFWDDGDKTWKAQGSELADGPTFTLSEIENVITVLRAERGRAEHKPSTIFHARQEGELNGLSMVLQRLTGEE